MLEFLMSWLVGCLVVLAIVAAIIVFSWAMIVAMLQLTRVVRWIWFAEPLKGTVEGDAEDWACLVGVVGIGLLPLTFLFLFVGVPFRLVRGRPLTSREQIDAELDAKYAAEARNS